jgi:hypothetical protein
MCIKKFRLSASFDISRERQKDDEKEHCQEVPAVLL